MLRIMKKLYTAFCKFFFSLFLFSCLPAVMAFFLSFFFLHSCRKADRDTDTATGMVSDNAFSAYFFNDIFRQAHHLALSDSSMNDIGSFFIADTLCIDTIIHTNTPGYFPDTITLNYGQENGAACSDGNLRRGKLKVVFNGKYGMGSKGFIIYPENYYLNDYKTEGKMVVTCKGRNAANNIYCSVEISDGVVSNDSMRMEYYAPYNGQSFQREWISGELTSPVSDDVFQLSGAYGGTASMGTTYKSQIASALQDRTDCKWMAGGQEILTPSNLSPREIDYGSGCDNKAMVTINGKEFEVTFLP